MKDLYTFDYSASLALETYHQVREMYARLFDELKIPYLVADADSGNMGGNLSHEFHFPTSKGEDHIISCDSCNYVANEELAEAAPVLDEHYNRELLSHQNGINESFLVKPDVWRGVSHDRKTLINVWYPHTPVSLTGKHDPPEVNIHAIKSIVPSLDASIEDPLSIWKYHASQLSPSFNSAASKSQPPQIINMLHFETEYYTKISNPSSDALSRLVELQGWEEEISKDFLSTHKIRRSTLRRDPRTGQPLNLMRIRNGDTCSRCSEGRLKVQKAIELGHTFHLGTRYSEPLEAVVTVPRNLLIEERASKPVPGKDLSTSQRVPMQMGCHGIGVSRIIGAVADTLADEKGLNWPRIMAPYEIVVIPAKGLEEAALEVYDMLSHTKRSPEETPLDLILDDRTETFPWKMGDADLVGYPIIIIVGKRWTDGKCEVQCRRLGIRQDVLLRSLSKFVRSLLDQL